MKGSGERVLDAVSFAQDAKAAFWTGQAFDPVRLVVFGAFELLLEEQGGIAVEETLHRQQMPPATSGPALVVRRVVLFETPAQVGRVAGIHFTAFGKQQVHSEAGQGGHHTGPGDGVSRPIEARWTSFQSEPGFSGL